MAIIYQEGEAGKICSHCDIWQPLTGFSKRSVGDGYQSHCKKCRAAHGKYIRSTFPERQKLSKRQYRMKNAEKISLFRKQYYLRNRDVALEYAREHRKRSLGQIRVREKEYYEKHRAYILVRRKRYYDLHVDEARRYGREYQKLHKERIQARQRRYRLEHPEVAQSWRAANRDKLQAMKQRRRARKRSAGPSFTSGEWAHLKRKYDYTCLYCLRRESEIRLVPDHVIPLGPPGTGLIENIQPLCDTCNKRKATKTTDYRKVWEQNNHQ
jgi:5-methylcytosine-specific restriction endonuclease McrA